MMDMVIVSYRMDRELKRITEEMRWKRMNRIDMKADMMGRMSSNMSKYSDRLSDESKMRELSV
jgi:hypothetical protein